VSVEKGAEMTTVELTGLQRDAEGFLTDPQQWHEDVADAIAAEAGIPELTARHWLVVRFMRDTYLATGQAPSIRTLGKASGVPIKELYSLFPKGPAKLAAKIAGIPKPRGCI
jgi:dissimilatory sulfite reductase related protein